MQQFNLLSDNMVKIKASADVINELQKERGISSGYIGSKGKHFTKALQEQYKKTDLVFNAFIQKNSTLKNNDYAILFLNLANTRSSIVAFHATAIKSFDFYTELIRKIQKDYLKNTVDVHDFFIKNKLQAYTNLSMMKEALGQLRGAYNAILAQGYLTKPLTYRVIHAKGTYDTSAYRFNAVASNKFLQRYRQVVHSSDYIWIMNVITKYTKKVKTNKTIEDSKEWYTKTTNTINKLYTLENEYINEMDTHLQKEYNTLVFDTISITLLFLLITIASILLSIKIRNSILKNISLLNEYKNAVDRSSIVSKTNKRGIITYVNEKFCSISGYSKEELLGKPHNIVRHQDMPKEAFKEMWQTILHKKPWFGIVKNRKKDGGDYTVEVTINPILDVDGEIEEFIAIRNDITDIINLHKEIEHTQEDLIFRMGEIGETRSKETGHHVKRVAKYSELLARYYGLNEEEIKYLTYASPMHDIGKVGIPDKILNKAGKLTNDEWNVMKSHSSIGYDLFKDSDKPLLQAAAIIAYEHHEKYDGSGYPRGLEGEDIHIYGRITALADVFDALGSDRCYKQAWDDQKIFDLLSKERGKHFDPELVDIFFNHLDEFLEIRHYFSDKSAFMKD